MEIHIRKFGKIQIRKDCNPRDNLRVVYKPILEWVSVQAQMQLLQS